MENLTVSSEKRKNSKGIFILQFLLILILIGTSGYFYYKYQKLAKNPITTQITAEEEAEKLTKKLGKLMLLPEEEKPTVATITDIEKLKDQSFFKDAKNGNKVLIYTEAKLAIIYDPELNIIINTGPINSSQSQETQQDEQISNIRIGLRNGTNIVGLTQKVETDIKTIFPEINVVLKDQDKQTDYEKSTLIVLNDTAKDTASELAKNFNFEIKELPEGEIVPSEVDILIILGKDKS